MSDEYISEFETTQALTMLLVEALFCSSLCMIVISILFCKLKQQRNELLEKKEKAKLELSRLRAIAAATKPPPSKAGPDPIDVTDPDYRIPIYRIITSSRGYTAPKQTPGSVTPPPIRLDAHASDPDAPPDSYKLALEHGFVAGLLACMAFPTGQSPSASFPLTIYSPTEVPLMEKDINGNDIGRPKIGLRCPIQMPSDPPVSGSGDMPVKKLIKKNKKKNHAVSGDTPEEKPIKKNKKKKKKDPSFDLVAIARGGSGSHSTAPAPTLPVGPPPKKPRREMAQSDLPIPTPPRKTPHV